MTSHQLINDAAKSLDADPWRPLLQKSLFVSSSLKGVDCSLLAAMPRHAFPDHSDCFVALSLAHVRPWLIKSFRGVGDRRNHRRDSIEVNCNWYERRHSCLSPGSDAAKRISMAVVA